MVKNKVGGNKAKKFARKNMSASMQQRKLRLVQNKDEIYGIVNKMVGNGQVIVMCIDGIERLCFIRNKFSGRNKQSNLVSPGSWVIIGKRSWESVKENKLEKCDLLEIYTDNEKHTLVNECNINFSNIFKEEQKMSHIDEDTFDNEHIKFEHNSSDNIVVDNIVVDNTVVEDNTTKIDDDIDFDEI